MFESQVTGECGGLSYMLRNLISKGQHGLFFNLKWRHLAYVECDENYGVWVYEPYIITLLKFIKAHRIAQISLILACIGDTVIWLRMFQIF